MAEYKLNFYPGGNYGFEFKDEQTLTSYNSPASSIGLATTPFTANQLAAVSEKLNTGAKTIEEIGRAHV